VQNEPKHRQTKGMKKPLHKHIGHQARKGYSKVTKYLTERDTMFATLWVFVFIVALGSIPLNLGVMNPLKLGLKDFDFNDLYYSKVGNKQNTPIDTNIVVINIGYADREGIAMMIDKVASFQPKVMGLDVVFDGPRDPIKDSILRETLLRNKNLVMASKYGVDSNNKLIHTGNSFLPYASMTGYVNFPHDDRETIRTYFPFRKDDKDKKLVLPSFTSELVRNYDSSAYAKILSKGDKQTYINYSRTVTARRLQYQILEGDSVLVDAVDSASIKGKIALMAYVNINPYDIEDKKFTPMNSKFYGKSTPDMNGILVHANIISMVLEKNYVKKVPLWGNILLAVVICWLHMSFFIHYYLESHIWFHLVAKIAQVLSAILFVMIAIEIFNRYHLKVDIKWSLITIVLAVDIIYFYEAWAVWMHKKFNYKTVFKPHHH
jgi:CHASE2 domain-containing sensor protein